MAGSKRTCSTCGNRFIGGARALYCSPACKQRAHRGRKGADRNGGRNARGVTAALPVAQDGHSAEAVELLRSLDEELAENSAEHGLLEPLDWSAAERAVRELIARNVDRQTDLWLRWQASDDDKTRVKLSAEIRLLETSLARLLRQVDTDLPLPRSRASEKAAKAARVKWRRHGAS